MEWCSSHQPKVISFRISFCWKIGRKKNISLNYIFQVVGFCFSLRWGGRQQLQNNKSIIHQNAQVLKHFVPLLFQGGPSCCLKTYYLFLSYPFAKTDPLSPAAATTPDAAVITSRQHNHWTGSPACPPNLWFIFSRSLWDLIVTQVLDPATNHSLLLFEDYTGGEGPGPHGPALPALSLTGSMVWELQANPPRSHCLLPWQSVYFHFPAHGFSSFLSPSQSRSFPPTKSSHLQTHPWSLPSNRAPTSWLSPKFRFYFSFAFSVCLWQ